MGPAENPTQYLLVLDDYHLEVKSPIHAVDAAFKVYHALHAKYPPEAEHMWILMQRAVYGFTTSSDRKFGDVESLVPEYTRYKI